MADIWKQLVEAWAPYHAQLAQKILGPVNGYMLIIIAIQILARIVPALTGSSGGKVEASHILVKDQAKAEELREQLLKDPSQFGAIAKQHSTCPSGKNGGSLGSFGKGQMVAEFDKYCFDRETKVNGISPLVKTQFGYHIIMVTKVPEAK